MNNIRSGGNPSRRKLLKSLAAGGGVVVAGKSIPGQWSQPVVDSVILPAHAQTSQVRYVPAAGAVAPGDLGAAPARNDSRVARILDTLVPRAEAAQAPSLVYHICVNPSPDGSSADVQVYVLSFPIESVECAPGEVVSRELYSAKDVPVGGSKGLDYQGDQCGERFRLGNWLDSLGIIRSARASRAAVELSSVENGATGKLMLRDEIDFDIRPGSCSVPDCCAEIQPE